jgi:perosamine synthetase
MIAEEEITAVVETLRSGWLTTGPKVKCLEQTFAGLVSARHAVAVNSATAALHLAVEAAGVQEGDEVIVPAMTFAATAEVVTYMRAKPVLVDCDPATLNIDPERVEAALTSRTKAIIPVHFAGQPCEMDHLLDIARRHGLTVIEDAAHALPARYRGQMIGSIGDITCFSFYATKTITTGEGGMITTENEELAKRMRLMSLHGISHNAWNRYTEEGSWYYEILEPGFKYNLSDIAAALGLAQLCKCKRFWDARKRIVRYYNEHFAGVPEIRCPVSQPNLDHAWHLYVVQLELDRLKVDRNEIVRALKERKIGTSVHFIPLHLHPYYRATFGYRPEDCPQATAAFDRIISLPVYPAMTDADAADVVEAVTDVVRHYRR